MGRTEALLEHGCSPLVRLEDGSWDGCSKGNVWGTYLHGFLDSEAVIRQLFSALLSPARRRAWLEFSTAGMGSYREFKSRQYDRLADHVEAHLDVARLIEILRQHD